MIELEELEEQGALSKLPSDVAAAWSSLDWLTHLHYKPILWLGKETGDDEITQYWFIAEQIVIFPTPVRRLVLLAISEYEGEYAVGEIATPVLAA